MSCPNWAKLHLNVDLSVVYSRLNPLILILQARIVGYTKVQGVVTNPRRTVALKLEFLVDTGAGYMVIPPDAAKELGLERIMKTKVVLANKAEVEANYSSAYVKVLDREVPVPVLIVDSPMPLLGALTLQTLGLEVDPVKEEVKPSRPFALGLLRCHRPSN